MKGLVWQICTVMFCFRTIEGQFLHNTRLLKKFFLSLRLIHPVFCHAATSFVSFGS